MRINKFLVSLDDSGFDAYIITREPNIFYFTGSTGGGVLILSPDKAPILLTSRLDLFITQDKAEGCDIEPFTKKNKTKKIFEKILEIKPNKIGFDELSISQFFELNAKLENIELIEKPDIIWEMRKVKDLQEQDLMKQAGFLSDIGMEAIRSFLKEGVREYEVAAKASYMMRKEGAFGISFPFIIASGPRSAYPHAGVSERKIKRGDLVTVDLGAAFREYRSDNTRTFIVGTPTKKQREIFETVFTANEVALPKIRDGSKGDIVDGYAREIIEEAGFGDNFFHGLGHGIGLEVHEPPSLSKTSTDVLSKGNVVSNEPGIYLRGYGGVRLEDTVLVTDTGPERFTKFEKNLDALRV